MSLLGIRLVKGGSETLLVRPLSRDLQETIPTTIPTVTMTNREHCWYVMSNKALTDISRTRTSWLVEIFSHEPNEDAED